MIDTRRRPPVSSTSTLPASQGSMPRRTGASVRSLSSGSITPMEDEEGESYPRSRGAPADALDRPKRSTRGRNPLPPTKGPLFPPLPPKPIRAKSSPRHPTGSGSEIRTQEAVEEDEAGPSEEKVEVEPPTEEPTPEPQGDKPSWSDRSLTPAPPSSDNVEVVVDVGATSGVRRNGRAAVDVKVEMEDEEEDGDTPKQPRSTRGRLAPSAGTTPTGSTTPDPASANARTSLGRRRRGEEQLLLDDHLLPVEIRRTGSLSGKRKSDVAEQEQEQVDEVEDAAEEEHDQAEEVEVVREGNVDEEEPPAEDDIIEQDLVDPDEEEPEEGDGEEVTRCVCQLEDGDPLMVACDKCNVWQHGPCVGIWADEEAPDEYFCERCRPELHGPLRKWMRSKGRNIAHFAPPMPDDLKHLHSQSDRYPPSQSKRWNAPKSKAGAARGRAKEAVSPHEPTDPRRLSRRGEPTPHPPAPSSHREKSAKAEAIAVRGREQRRGSSHHRKASIGSGSPIRDSRSPTAMVHKDRETRKRSTMNSRDAAFEDAVQAAIEASKREMGDEEEGEEEVLDDANEEEREKEVDKKKGKRKREEEIDPENPSAPHSSSHPKVKHPNQYTYRPKPSSAAAVVIPTAPSPARRVPQASTPVPPQLPPPALHEHGTRRAGALANGAREAPFIAVSVTHLGWHLPDYLSGFSDIFPSPIPTPLQVRSPRTLPPIPKNHFLNHRYGPFSEARPEGAGLALPPDPVEREAVGKKGETHTEPPARMKYPQKRVTTGEMRKRVRHMLEFCGRVEVEEGRRRERKVKLGIPDAEDQEDEGEDVEMANGDERPQLPSPRNSGLQPPAASSSSGSSPGPTVKPTSTSSGPTAAQLLAELTADLNDFNETWARGGFAPLPSATAGPSTGSSSASGSGANGTANGWSGGYGGYSPIPPGSATFAQGNGWPTSGLGRGVVGAEEYEGSAADEAADEGAGHDEAPGSAEGGQEVEGIMDVPVEVYREGEVVGIVSTEAEDEAVQRIKANTARSEERAAEAEGEEAAEEEAASMAAVALLQGVGVIPEAIPRAEAEEKTEEEAEVGGMDGDGDVVMAE